MMNTGKGRRKNLGNRGEKIAERFLRKKGLKIIEMNYRNRFGEIDIIAKDGGCIVFVEVKTSASRDFSAPETWVNKKKQYQLAKMARFYLFEWNISDVDCRFDVIGIRIVNGKKEEIEHIRDAFML